MSKGREHWCRRPSCLGAKRQQWEACERDPADGDYIDIGISAMVNMYNALSFSGNWISALLLEK